MTTDLSRVQSLFLEVVESSDPAGYAAALDRVCAGDAELRRRVEGLLEAHHQPAELLDRPIVGRAGRVAWPYGWAPGEAPGGETETPDRPFPVIPGYEILGELGRGGMGVVYQARQVRLNRPCALKMILAGAHADAEAAVRFLAEAEAVARLAAPQHRADPRHRRGRRPALLRAGVRRGRQPGPAARRHALAGAAGGRRWSRRWPAASPRRTGRGSSTAT